MNTLNNTPVVIREKVPLFEIENNRLFIHSLLFPISLGIALLFIIRGHSLKKLEKL